MSSSAIKRRCMPCSASTENLIAKTIIATNIRKNGAASSVVPIEKSGAVFTKAVCNQPQVVQVMTATKSEAHSARTKRCRTKPETA